MKKSSCLPAKATHSRTASRKLSLALLASIFALSLLGVPAAFAEQTAADDAQSSEPLAAAAATTEETAEEAADNEAGSEAGLDSETGANSEAEESSGAESDPEVGVDAEAGTDVETGTDPEAEADPEDASTPDEEAVQLEPQEEPAKNGSITITSTITNSWDGDNRPFEIWVEIGDRPTYGELSFTITEKDGTVHAYVLNPDVDELEAIDRLTDKDIEGTQSGYRNVFYAFLLRGGETAVIGGIPTGSHYQCYVAGGHDYHGTNYNARYEAVYNSTMSNTSGGFREDTHYHCNAVHRRYLQVTPVVKPLINGLDYSASFDFRATLLEEDGTTPISNYTAGTGTDGVELVTDENGQIEFSVPANGYVELSIPVKANYEVEELIDDNGRYRLNEIPEKASGMATPATTPLYFFNIERYQVSIEKQDASGHLIPGARLQIIDDKGNVVEEWTSEAGKPTTLWLDMTNGIDQFNVPRSYTLHEVEPPAGYAPADDITFTISYPGADGTPEITLENGTVVDSIAIVNEEIPHDDSVAPSTPGEQAGPTADTPANAQTDSPAVSKPNPQKPSATPKTHDDTSLLPMYMLLALGTAVVLAGLVLRKRVQR